MVTPRHLFLIKCYRRGNDLRAGLPYPLSITQMGPHQNRRRGINSNGLELHRLRLRPLWMDDVPNNSDKRAARICGSIRTKHHVSTNPRQRTGRATRRDWQHERPSGHPQPTGYDPTLRLLQL